MKAFTDLEQSKKLAEILPLESADMRYAPFGDIRPWVWDEEVKLLENGAIPCWSLAALLSVLPIIGEGKDTANPFIAKTPVGEYYVVYATLYKEIDSSGIYSNPIDACYEMIIHLHEQNLL